MSKFDKIAADAIKKAEKVDCPLTEFRDGLASIISDLEERLEQVNAEIKSKSEESGDEEEDAEEEDDDDAEDVGDSDDEEEHDDEDA